MCLPPQDEIAHESARRKRAAPSTTATAAAPATAVVASPLPAARRFPSRIVSRNATSTTLTPRVTFQDARVVHVIPTVLSQLYEHQEASSSSSSTGDNDKLSSCPPNTTTTTDTAATTLLQDCRRQLWYNRSDIQDFRLQAQTITQRLRGGQTATKSDSDEEEDAETRGLEVRMSFQRQDRKQMIVRRILSAQKNQGASPQALASISQSYSLWSCKLALAQAHKDYYAVYHPHLAVLPELPAMLDCHQHAAVAAATTGSSASSKRSYYTATAATSAVTSSYMGSSSLEQHSGRRVRCRMY